MNEPIHTGGKTRAKPIYTGAKTRAKLAGTTNAHGPNAPETQAARRDHKVAMLEAYITRAVAQAPKPSTEQRIQLAAIRREFPGRRPPRKRGPLRSRTGARTASLAPAYSATCS